ncbi:unnamed protein product [Rotaria sp. Silwood1]|nr:unnamed protein product [Rotaria sp. Silwood1]
MNKTKNIQVYEIVPPAVQTNLGGSHSFGEPLVGYYEARKTNSREDVDKHFMKFNDNMKKVFQSQQH